MRLFSVCECVLVVFGFLFFCDAAGEGGLVVDAESGEAFDSMLHRDARFWAEIAARKVQYRVRWVGKKKRKKLTKKQPYGLTGVPCCGTVQFLEHRCATSRYLTSFLRTNAILF